MRSGWEQKRRWKNFFASRGDEASEEDFERFGGGAKHASEYFWRRGQTTLLSGREKKRRWTDFFTSRGDTKRRTRNSSGSAETRRTLASILATRPGLPAERLGTKAQLVRPFRIAGRRAASEEEFERLGGDTKHASEYFWRRGRPSCESAGNKSAAGQTFSRREET